MVAGKCTPCPKGTLCSGGSTTETEKGFWRADDDKPGFLKSQLDLLGVSAKVYDKEPWRTPFSGAFSSAIESVTLTGSGSTKVDTIQQGKSSTVSMEVGFTVTVPVGIDTAAVVEQRLMASQPKSRRASLVSALTTNLNAKGLNASSFKLGVGTLKVIQKAEPIAASGVTYSCPFPLNCKPAGNDSLCTLGKLRHCH